jgi:hypothetical protein
MSEQVSIFLDLPVDGNGDKYAAAIAKAIATATDRNDRNEVNALSGLLAVLRLTEAASTSNFGPH